MTEEPRVQGRQVSRQIINPPLALQRRHHDTNWFPVPGGFDVTTTQRHIFAGGSTFGPSAQNVAFRGYWPELGV